MSLTFVFACVFRASLVCAFATSRAFAGALVCGRSGFVTGTFVCANRVFAVLVKTLAATFHGANMLAFVRRSGRIGVARYEHGANYAHSKNDK